MFRDLNSLVPNYCVAQFGEKANDIECVNLLDVAVLTPYVELTFLNFGFTLMNGLEEPFKISVGNNSSPLLENTAAIKSFTCSMGQGMSTVFQITDTDGGNFARIYHQVNVANCKQENGTNENGVANLNNVSWDWGWIGVDEAGNSRKILASAARRFAIPNCDTKISLNNDQNNKCYGHVSDIKVSVDSKSGLFKYDITILDVGQAIFQTKKGESVFGKEGAEAALTEAMEELITGVCGEVKNKNPNIRFLIVKLNNDKTIACESFKPKDGGAKGPKGVWPALGLSPQDALTEWKNNFVGANGKGSIHGAIPSDPPILILATLPDHVDAKKINNANDNVKVKDQNPSLVDITYIVNGGNNSSVISFEPKFTYVQSIGEVGSGGNAGGAAGPGKGVGQGPNNGDPAATPGQDGQKVPEKSGPQVRIPVRYYDLYNASPTNVLQKKAEAYIAQAKTMGIMENLPTYKADLTIQGDPIRYGGFWDVCAFKNIGIIFINPFQLSKKPPNENAGSLSDFNWIAPDVCNPLLTRIMNLQSVTHNIEAGKYTTKLSLVDTSITDLGATAPQANDKKADN